MRALIFVLIVAIILVVAALATGFVNIARVGGQAAEVNGVNAKGAQAPPFDVETGSVKVGTKETTVKVPALIVQKPGREPKAPVTNAE